MNSIFVSIECLAFSGATLLSFLLDSHPQIASIGEMDGLIARENPDEYLCSCGQKIKDCPFWQSVSTAMEQRDVDFNIDHFNTRFKTNSASLVNRLRFGSFKVNILDSTRNFLLRLVPSEKQRVNHLIYRNTALIESVLDVSNKDVFVDTSKEHLRARYLHKYSDLNVYAIHLIRDVRGYVASRMRRNNTLLHPLTTEQTTQQWVKENKKYQRTLQILPPSKRLLIRYEDLCLETEATLKKIYQFCGVDDQIFISNFISTQHHILGNAMRLRSSSEIKLDERWKTSLTKEQLTQINKIAGNLSRKLGYQS